MLETVQSPGGLQAGTWTEIAVGLLTLLAIFLGYIQFRRERRDARAAQASLAAVALHLEKSTEPGKLRLTVSLTNRSQDEIFDPTFSVTSVGDGQVQVAKLIRFSVRQRALMRTGLVRRRLGPIPHSSTLLPGQRAEGTLCIVGDAAQIEATFKDNVGRPWVVSHSMYGSGSATGIAPKELGLADYQARRRRLHSADTSPVTPREYIG